MKDRLAPHTRAVIKSLVEKHGTPHRARIESGVNRCATLWQESDGSPEEFVTFCSGHFVADPSQEQLLLDRLERNLEILIGHTAALQRELSAPHDLTSYLPTSVDVPFAEYSPMAHITEDLFNCKIAFQIALNFPMADLETRNQAGRKWSRVQWASERLASRISERIPASVSQAVSSAQAKAESYISAYDISVHLLHDEEEKPLFGTPRALISHWGLRDEIRSQYGEQGGLPRQEALYQVMCHIVEGTIPTECIGKSNTCWRPGANLIGKAGHDAWARGTPEGSQRYEHLRQLFLAHRAQDPFSNHPTHMARSFLAYREISEERTRALFDSILSSPLLKRAGDYLSKILMRPLHSFDIWFQGFRQESTGPRQDELDAVVRQRFPTTASFQNALPSILQSLGFSAEKSEWLAQRIVVDPSRGAGHAAPCNHRGDCAHLRTRIGEGGMDYKGFNIAIHELGHNVEQVFSLYGMDHWLLSGVPNTAFTEAFAFAFQSRDREVLGHSAVRDHGREALQELWQTAEIASVALVDMDLWHWMYAHPQANAEDIRQATLDIARSIWNRYWRPVIGVGDSPILAIYSHIISASLYTPDYPLGHLISYQIERHLRTHPLATEMERMCRLGCLTPDLWMEAAVGEPLSADPLLKDVEQALNL